MTTDAFTTAARAEAERFLWSLPDDHPAKPLANDGFMQTHARVVAGLMAEWARDHLAAQEPTDAECVAVLNVKYGGTVGPHDEPYDAEEMAEARAALTAARKARA